MNVVKSYEVNKKTAKHHLLIASQGSPYKNSLVNDLIDELKNENLYIKVMDVTHINSTQVNEWDAIIVIHTWEAWKPQKDALAFLNANYHLGKIFVVSTSGSGDEKIDGVDAITGASVLSEIPTQIDTIKTWVESQLNSQENND